MANLIPLLTHFSINDFTVKNSSIFANEICNLTFICEDSYMTSLDIESLHTYIPLTETIQICLDEVFTVDPSNFAGFTRKLFFDSLQLAVSSSFFFLFNSKIYLQKDNFP